MIYSQYFKKTHFRQPKNALTTHTTKLKLLVELLLEAPLLCVIYCTPKVEHEVVGEAECLQL